jgi:hypothetical protein
MKIEITKNEACRLLTACTLAKQVTGEADTAVIEKLHDKILSRINEYDSTLPVFTITVKPEMKDYNHERYWILTDYYTHTFEYPAATLREALEKLRADVESHGFEISKNAIRPRNMRPFWYSNSDDPAGLIITGSMTFYDYQNRIRPPSKQFIDVFREISCDRPEAIDYSIYE